MSGRRLFRRLAARIDERRRTRHNLRRVARNATRPGPARLKPVWPLPRCPEAPSPDEIRRRFAQDSHWLYALEFEGLGFPGPRETIGRRGDGRPERPLQRFAHFMPWVIEAAGGSLRGKRVLDIACNAGFWSIQCALLGAEEVVGFDARPELVAQAEFVRSVVGATNARFRVLDFWAMTPEALGGRFDVVLNLGLLYHLPRPLEALERTRDMSRDVILLDTALHVARAPLMLLAWEEPEDIGSAAQAGLVMFPSKRGVELMLRHVGLTDFVEVPLRSRDVSPDYLRDERVSWLIRTRGAGPR